MTNETIKAWCYKVWVTHWRDLAPSSNSRSMFVKEVIKLKPDEEELDRIALAIVAQTKHWRMKSKIEKVFGIPRLSQWIKDCRFDDEFIDETAVSMKERLTLNICDYPHCQNEVVGEKFRKCRHHHGRKEDRYRAKKIEVMTKEGLMKLAGESVADYAQRCRQNLSKSGKSGILPAMTRRHLS